MISPKEVYERLKVLGVSRAQARRLLPDWWMPEMETSPDGAAELCVLLSRRLHLDFSDLARGLISSRDKGAAIAYKHAADQDPTSLQAATGIARSLAETILAASRVKQVSVPTSPEVFTALAKQHGNGVVGLASLIDACWSIGIPVIPMSGLPVGIRKMDGAVVQVDRGIAIIISRKKSSRAWLAFILGHEIGHLASGHVGKAGSIVDVSLQEQATYAAESSADAQEQEADDFALSIMGGAEADAAIAAWSPQASPITLAVDARQAARPIGVEPGHLILRFAFKTKRWTEAAMALNYLREDADADAVMKQALQRNLDFDLIADDMSDFVRQMTGLG